MESYERCIPEGTLVSFVLNDGIFIGKIRGVSSQELPVVGYTYIIEILKKKPGKDWQYPYSCVALPRTLFDLGINIAAEGLQ